MWVSILLFISFSAPCNARTHMYRSGHCKHSARSQKYVRLILELVDLSYIAGSFWNTIGMHETPLREHSVKRPRARTPFDSAQGGHRSVAAFFFPQMWGDLCAQLEEGVPLQRLKILVQPHWQKDEEFGKNKIKTPRYAPHGLKAHISKKCV